jgi:general secretion pathway protein G
MHNMLNPMPNDKSGHIATGAPTDTPLAPSNPRPARRARGFTLIELIVVMSVIALLLTIAVPRYFSSLDNARVNVQRQNIAAIRDAIDKFFGDQGRYPNSLAELVDRRYLRTLPLDPVSESSEWTVIAPQDTTLGSVYDVRPPPAPPNSAGGGSRS